MAESTARYNPRLAEETIQFQPETTESRCKQNLTFMLHLML